VSIPSVDDRAGRQRCAVSCDEGAGEAPRSEERRGARLPRTADPPWRAPGRRHASACVYPTSEAAPHLLSPAGQACTAAGASFRARCMPQHAHAASGRRGGAIGPRAAEGLGNGRSDERRRRRNWPRRQGGRGEMR
jgi:hypothetical protein